MKKAFCSLLFFVVFLMGCAQTQETTISNAAVVEVPKIVETSENQAQAINSQPTISKDSEEKIIIRWNVLHPPVDYFLEAANHFKDRVEQLSQGEIQVIVTTDLENDVPDSISDYAEELILNGSTDMMQVYTGNLQTKNPQLRVLDTPNLFRDDDHVDRVVDGPIGKELLEGIDTDELKALAFTFSGGFVNFVSQSPEIQNLNDIRDTRARISERGSKSYQKELGFNELSKEDKQKFLQEAVEEQLADVWEQTAQDALPFFETGEIQSLIKSRHRVIFTTIMMNKQLYDSLSNEHKTIVKLAAKEAAKKERHSISSDGRAVLNQFAEKVHQLSESDKKKLQAIKRDYITQNLNEADKKLLDKIEKSNQDDIVIQWRVLHPPIDYFLQAANRFRDRVEELSDGKITVEVILPENLVHTNHEFDSEALILEGHTDMMQVYIHNLVDYNPDFKILMTPYLFKDEHHVDKVVDGKIGKSILSEMQTKNLEGLAFTFSGGFMSLLSTEPDLNSIRDLGGLRYLDFDKNKLLANELGLISTLEHNPSNKNAAPLDYLLSTKGIEVWEQTAQDALGYLEQDVSKSIINSRHRVVFTGIMMNKHLFETLSPEHQSIVRKAALDAAKLERDAISADGEEVLRKYAEIVSEITPEDHEALERVKERYIEQELENVNRDLLQKIEDLR